MLSNCICQYDYVISFYFIFFFPYEMTELLYKDLIQSTSKSVFLPFVQWSYLWAKYRYLHSLCKLLRKTVLILPKANDVLNDTGPDPAL